MARIKYIQHPQTGKLVPEDEVDWPRHKFRRPFQIMEDIEPFVSPVDGTVVSSRSKLREHNRRNDVVNFHEFDGERERAIEKRKEFFEGKSPEHKKDVLNDIIAASEKVAQGYKPKLETEGDLT